MSERSEEKCSFELAEDEQADQFLVELAEELTVLFPPVQPGKTFRRQLHNDLLATMRQRATMQIAFPREHRRWALIAGATVGSLVSLCGLAAYLVRSRLMSRAQHATVR